jgi:hypothetical protein
MFFIKPKPGSNIQEKYNELYNFYKNNDYALKTSQLSDFDLTVVIKTEQIEKHKYELSGTYTFSNDGSWGDCVRKIFITDLKDFDKYSNEIFKKSLEQYFEDNDLRLKLYKDDTYDDKSERMLRYKLGGK